MRLFLALWPDDATRDAMAQWQRGWIWPPAATPVAAERLHLTLHFIGNVPSRELPRLAGGLRVPFEPFDFELTQAEVWPNSVAVLAPQRPPEAMKLLHRRLAEGLRQLELPVESRPLRPHVTLARRAGGAVPPPQHAGLLWRARHGYVLAQSLPGAAAYPIMQRF